MIYLDYSATTPVDKEILDIYCKITKEYMGNINSSHALGMLSNKKYNESLDTISKIFNCKNEEIIFTSCASESNTTAIRGVINPLLINKVHIITSKLEHNSILSEMDNLEKLGCEISYVKILPNGLIDLNDLSNLIKDNTILISICGVNAETGYVQDLKAIKDIMKKKKSIALLHSDLTQALGKIEIDLSPLDMASFSSHKIYAPMGCGILYKKDNINLNCLISGGTKNTPYRGGTPSLPLIVSFVKAIEKANNNLFFNNLKCIKLNKIIIEKMKKYPICINSNENSIPEIINISLISIDSKEFLKKLEFFGICLSTKSACCSKEKSEVLYAITHDEKISTTSIRISLSHLTTKKEVELFLSVFDAVYNSYHIEGE